MEGIAVTEFVALIGDAISIALRSSGFLSPRIGNALVLSVLYVAAPGIASVFSLWKEYPRRDKVLLIAKVAGTAIVLTATLLSSAELLRNGLEEKFALPHLPGVESKHDLAKEAREAKANLSTAMSVMIAVIAFTGPLLVAVWSMIVQASYEVIRDTYMLIRDEKATPIPPVSELRTLATDVKQFIADLETLSIRFRPHFVLILFSAVGISISGLWALVFVEQENVETLTWIKTIFASAMAYSIMVIVMPLYYLVLLKPFQRRLKWVSILTKYAGPRQNGIGQ